MELLHLAQLIIVLLSLTLATYHFRLKKKQLLHLIFAIFCASTSLYVAHKLTSTIWAPYHHLIGVLGVGVSGTYWLFARAFFRKSNPINQHHLIFVGLLSACLILQQLLLLYKKVWLVHSVWLSISKNVLTEIVAILYPGMLILIFWEGYRVLNNSAALQRKMATIYLSSFIFCVVSVMLIGATLPAELLTGNGRDWLSTFSFLVILLSTHGLILFRQQQLNQKEKNTAPSVQEEPALAQQIHPTLVDEKRYLESSLRVSDIARELNVPEYRIRSVMLNHFNAKNFNHYVNQMRIEYAKTILSAPDKNDWPVLVIGIESGFGSAAPFTRAFKEFTGFTPGQYRKQQAETK